MRFRQLSFSVQQGKMWRDSFATHSLLWLHLNIFLSLSLFCFLSPYLSFSFSLSHTHTHTHTHTLWTSKREGRNIDRPFFLFRRFEWAWHNNTFFFFLFSILIFFSLFGHNSRAEWAAKVGGFSHSGFWSWNYFFVSSCAWFIQFKKKHCRPQVVFFPIIKVIPQFLKRGISSNMPLIQRIYKS